MQRPLKSVLAGVIGASIFNYFLVALFGDIAFNIGRLVIILLGGWLVVTSAARGLWWAAAIGPLVLLVDHVAFKGGYFVLAHFFFPATVDGNELASAAGVLISFFMFLPIAALLSLLGGFFARRKNSNATAHP